MYRPVLRLSLLLSLLVLSAAAVAAQPRARSSATGIAASTTQAGATVNAIAPIPTVSDDQTGDYAHSVTLPLVSVGGISASDLSVSTAWSKTAGNVQNTSTAQADSAGTSVAGLVALALDDVRSRAAVSGNCAAGSLVEAGSTTVRGISLSVRGLPVLLPPLPDPLPPNYVVALPPTAGLAGATLLLNEQTVSGNGTLRALDVNGARADLEVLSLTGQSTRVSLTVARASARVDCNSDTIFDNGYD